MLGSGADDAPKFLPLPCDIRLATRVQAPYYSHEQKDPISTRWLALRFDLQVCLSSLSIVTICQRAPGSFQQPRSPHQFDMPKNLL